MHLYTTLTGCVGRKGECSYIQEMHSGGEWQHTHVGGMNRCGQTLGEIIITHRKMPKKHDNANQLVASSKFYNYYRDAIMPIHIIQTLFPSTHRHHYLQHLYTCSNESSFYDTDYLDDLLAETILQCTCVETSRPMNIPEPLCSGYERPDKDSAVTRHRSRFILNGLIVL